MEGTPEREEPSKRVRSLEKSRTSTCAFADAVANSVLKSYRSLEIRNEAARAALQSSVVQTCVAAVVLTDGHELVVCSLGVGTKVVSEGDAENDHIGQRVLDCHAEILAKRGFVRFLYSQLRLVRAGSPSIFHYEEGRLDVRECVKFHLYCSSAPCGNACVRRWAKGTTEVFQADLDPWSWPAHIHTDTRMQIHSPLQITVLCKMATGQERDEAGMKYTADEVPPGTTLPNAPDASSRATCSDKIARWVALGMEGGLFNSLMRPAFAGIKPATVIVGRKFSRPHLERAICCRMGRFWKPSECRPSVLCTSVKLQEGGKDALEKAIFTDFALAWALESDRQNPAQVLVASKGLPLSEDEIPLFSRNAFWGLYHEARGSPFPEPFTQAGYARLKREVTDNYLRDKKEQLFANYLRPWPSRRFRAEVD
jgi:hypothetical protein